MQIVNMTGKYFPAAPSSRCLVNATDSDGRWSLVGQGQCVWKSYQTDFFLSNVLKLLMLVLVPSVAA